MFTKEKHTCQVHNLHLHSYSFEKLKPLEILQPELTLFFQKKIKLLFDHIDHIIIIQLLQIII